MMLAGTPFWERTEVKDLLAYLRLAATLSDEVALSRIINRPARAIGAKTVEKLQAWADAAGQSLCTALFGTHAVSTPSTTPPISARYTGHASFSQVRGEHNDVTSVHSLSTATSSTQGLSCLTTHTGHRG